jgi:formylglycine-generating enzyme required for sulfatase activity
MVLIPAGSFTMGSEDGDSDEKPLHTVTLGAFYIDEYEVTFDLYDRFCEATGRDKPADCGWSRGTRPVINVSWDDAVAYATHYGKRLPTEAEWEYAARGTDGRTYPWGNAWDGRLLNFADARKDGLRGSGLDENDRKVDWKIRWADTKVDDGFPYTAPVGSFDGGRSPFGCWDMAGNVWEWCADWYGRYPAGPSRDPNGPATGKARVLRGGSWVNFAKWCRSANRNRKPPATRTNYYGFRCAKSAGVR